MTALGQSARRRVFPGLLSPLIPAPLATTSTAPRTLRESLRAITAEGAAFSTMVGIGETFLAAFVLAMGMTQVASGLISTVPMLAGGALQLVSPYAVRLLRSNRRWVVLCAMAQGLSFLPLIYAAVTGEMPVWTVFVVASVYWGAGLATGPAWNTWMHDVIPHRIRPRYFACRTRIGQAAVLAGFLVGGLLLQLGSAVGQPLVAFAVIFTVASGARLYSAWLHFQQEEPVRPDASHRPVSLAQLRELASGSHVGRLLAYLLVMQAAVNISGPYFNAYMLVQLKLSYLEYIILIAAAFVARIVLLPLHGWLAKRFGAHTLLWIGGLGIVPTSAMWLISNDFPFLIFIQVVAGAMWAAYELAVFLLFFEAIKPEERTGVLTIYNFGHAAALVLGALIGGALLRILGTEPYAYLTLFAISSSVRLLAVGLLARIGRTEVKAVAMPTRTVAVRPNSGMIQRPVITALEE